MPLVPRRHNWPAPWRGLSHRLTDKARELHVERSVIVCHLLVLVPHPLINVGFGPNTCTPSEGRDEELALSACTNLSW